MTHNAGSFEQIWKAWLILLWHAGRIALYSHLFIVDRFFSLAQRILWRKRLQLYAAHQPGYNSPASYVKRRSIRIMAIGNTTPGFAQDVKPLFREEDRDAMEYAFNLWDYNDVRDQADNILERLEDGSMPCDAPWSNDRIELFRRWITAGTPA
jgi:hypothetical protein